MLIQLEFNKKKNIMKYKKKPMGASQRKVSVKNNLIIWLCFKKWKYKKSFGPQFKEDLLLRVI
jgi:hypothetical protein